MNRDPVALARATFRNAVALSFVGLLAKAMGLVVAILVARYLGPAGLGLFALLFGLSLLAEQIAAFGVPDVTLRAVGADPAHSGSHWHAGRRLVLALSAAPALGFAAAAIVLRGDPQVALSLLLAAACIPLTAVGNVGQAVLQGTDQVGYVTWVNFAARVGSLVLLAVLLAAGSGVEAAFVARLTFQGAITAAYLVRLRVDDGARDDASAARPLLASAVPFGVARGLGELTLRLPLFTVSATLGLVATGLYDAADRVSQILQIVIAAGLSSLLPVFARSVALGDASSDAYVRNSLRFTLLLVGLAGVGLAALGPEVVNLLYGSQYQASAALLVVLVASQVVVAGDAVLRQAMFAHGRERAAMWTAAATALVLLALALPLAGVAGTRGVAYASLLASVAILGMDALLLRRGGVRLQAWNSLARPLAACAPAFVLAALTLHWPWPLRLAAVLATFVSACGMLRVLRLDELRFVARAMTRDKPGPPAA